MREIHLKNVNEVAQIFEWYDDLKNEGKTRREAALEVWDHYDYSEEEWDADRPVKLRALFGDKQIYVTIPQEAIDELAELKKKTRLDKI